MIEIVRKSATELKDDPKLKALEKMYVEEAGIRQIAEGSNGLDAYCYLNYEKAGFLRLFGAYKEKELVGVLVLLVAVNPQYGKKTVTIDMIYSFPEYREFIGSRLLAKAIEVAKDEGVNTVTLSALHGSSLYKQLLESKRFAPVNTTFLMEI